MILIDKLNFIGLNNVFEYKFQKFCVILLCLKIFPSSQNKIIVRYLIMFLSSKLIVEEC